MQSQQKSSAKFLSVSALRGHAPWTLFDSRCLPARSQTGAVKRGPAFNRPWNQSTPWIHIVKKRRVPSCEDDQFLPALSLQHFNYCLWQKQAWYFPRVTDRAPILLSMPALAGALSSRSVSKWSDPTSFLKSDAPSPLSRSTPKSEPVSPSLRSFPKSELPSPTGVRGASAATKGCLLPACSDEGC